MKFETKYKILLVKGWFDKGFSVTSQFKYIFYFLALYFGFEKYETYHSLIGYVGLAYLIVCLPLGWAWFKYEWILAEQEVNNRYNPFPKEVRKFIKNKNTR